MKIYPKRKDIFYLNYQNLTDTSKDFNENKIIYFSGSDSKKNFDDLLKITSIDWHYRTKEVFYKINNSGYRTSNWDSIDWENSIVIFGCSCVFGVGLAEDETINYYLEQMTGKKVINMGYGGGSNDLMIDNCAFMINNFGYPKNVVFCWTFPDRFLFFYKNIHLPIASWLINQDSELIKKEDQDVYKNIYNNRIKNNYYLQMISHNQKTIVKAMLKDKSHFIDFSFYKDISQTFDCHLVNENINQETELLARDLTHPGRKDTFLAAQHIYNNLK